MRNESNDWMILIGEEPLAPRHIRLYEFLHGYEDIPLQEYDARESFPGILERDLADILVREIQKEIDKTLIETICRNAKEGNHL